MRGLVYLSVFAFLVGCQVKQPHVGLWSLHEMLVRDSAGNLSPYKNGMEGYLLYDAEKNMTIHLWQKGFKEYANPYPNFTADVPLADLQNLTKSYYYIGEYELLNDSVVQHTRISHSNPNDWGQTVQRKFTIVNDTLTIVPAEQKNANLKLVWTRSQ